MTAPVAMMAEFASGETLLEALRALARHGVTRIDTFTPYEVHGLEAQLGVRRSRLGWIALVVGLAAGGGAYLLQWWINVVDYPLDIGGRPYHSAPAFLPITFEMTVLFASAAALVSAIVLGGLPRLWHPVFEVDGFERATIDRFWLAIDAGDPALERAPVATALEAAGALRVVHLGGSPIRGAALPPEGGRPAS
jgi:hypothetical protein